MLSFQNKFDVCDAHKYANTNKESFRNDETLSNNDSVNDESNDRSDEKFIFLFKKNKWGQQQKCNNRYGSNNEINNKGECHNKRKTAMNSMRKKGGKKGGRIRKYVRCDIVDDEFEAQAENVFKDLWPRALTCKKCLDILLLQVHLHKDHSQRCRKMGPICKAPASNVSTTLAYIFLQKRDLVQSVWAEYVKENRVTVNALPCNSQLNIYQQIVPIAKMIICQIREFIRK